MIGSGGLLGRAVVDRCHYRFDAGSIPWHDEQAAADWLRAGARRFCEVADTEDWAIIWAAGAATTSTSESDATKELTILEGLLQGLRSALPQGKGSFFLASSAGGVYAGSKHPPFTTATQTAPLSAYGELKLRQEHVAAEYLKELCPVTIGRISNLYGPGQNLSKLQGLISLLARAAVTRQPVNIFVPLDTIRDYVFSQDAATAVQASVNRARVSQLPISVEIIASGEPATIGQLIRSMNQVSRRRVPVALGMHASATAQAADLRVLPTYVPQSLTPLPAGVKSVYLDILERLQHRSLTAY